jgi:hypothetical protein
VGGRRPRAPTAPPSSSSPAASPLAAAVTRVPFPSLPFLCSPFRLFHSTHSALGKPTDLNRPSRSERLLSSPARICPNWAGPERVDLEAHQLLRSPDKYTTRNNSERRPQCCLCTPQQRGRAEEGKGEKRTRSQTLAPRARPPEAPPRRPHACGAVPASRHGDPLFLFAVVSFVLVCDLSFSSHPVISLIPH